MATLILGIAGGIGGALIAGPGGAVKGAMLGWSIGTTVGSIIDQSNQHFYTADMGRTNDLRLTVASYGTSIPQCWGKTRIPGILIWGTDLVEHETDINSGGGGSGGPQVTTKSYTYTNSFALLLCKGNRTTTNSVKKIYCDDLVVYDSSVPASQNRINPRFYSGSETQAADPLIIAQAGNTDIPAGSDNPAFRGSCYMVVQDMLQTDFGNRLGNFSVLMDTGTVYVSDVITDILLELGLTTSQIDVSLVTTIQVTGMVVASRIDAKSALQPILDEYSVDLIDVDGKIKAVPRGGDPVATITFDDMGAQIIGSGVVPPTQRIQKSRIEDLQLPTRIDVGYFSTSIDLQQATQGAVRQSARHDNPASVSYPLTLEDAEAKKLAERLLYQQWIERMTYSASLMPYLEYLSCADVVMLQTDVYGTVQRVRIVEMEDGMRGEIRTKFVRDEAKVLVQKGSSPVPTGGFSASDPVPTTFFAWSGKELRDGDGVSAGFYVAATGAVGWQGCSILISVDGGLRYTPVGSVGSRSIFGSASASLGTGGTPNSNGFDVTNTVNVAVNNPLSSTNETDVHNGVGNYGLLLKSDTSVDNSADYEVFGFAAASLVSGGVYTLSDLLRSQRNTVATGHVTGDVFVQLTSAITRIAVSSKLVGQTILVKCLSQYQDPSTVTAQTVYIATPTAPYASGSDVTSAANAAKTPWYRTRWKIDVYNDSSGTTVPGASDFASGYTAGTFYANGPDGSVKYSDPGLEFQAQFRIGLRNTTGSNITVNWQVPYIDNGAQGIWNGGSPFFSYTSAGSTHSGSGTFTVNANSQGVLELYYYNASTGINYDTANQASFNFFMDALLNNGLTWYDPGA